MRNTNRTAGLQKLRKARRLAQMSQSLLSIVFCLQYWLSKLRRHALIKKVPRVLSSGVSDTRTERPIFLRLSQVAWEAGGHGSSPLPPTFADAGRRWCPPGLQLITGGHKNLQEELRVDSQVCSLEAGRAGKRKCSCSSLLSTGNNPDPSDFPHAPTFTPTWSELPRPLPQNPNSPWTSSPTWTRSTPVRRPGIFRGLQMPRCCRGH